MNTYSDSTYDDEVANYAPVAIAPVEPADNLYETASPYDSEIPPYTGNPQDAIAAANP